MSTYYIDQSQKIEQTNKDTVIGISNGFQYTVLISRKIKRQLQEDFRKQAKPRLFVYRTFIASVVLGLVHADIKFTQSDHVIIDIEYYGKEKMLTSMFVEMFTRHYEVIPRLRFQQIGKKSNAHAISYLTARRDKKPDNILSYGQLKRLANP